jgi:hypothetical protein
MNADGAGGFATHPSISATTPHLALNAGWIIRQHLRLGKPVRTVGEPFGQNRKKPPGLGELTLGRPKLLQTRCRTKFEPFCRLTAGDVDGPHEGRFRGLDIGWLEPKKNFATDPEGLGKMPT